MKKYTVKCDFQSEGSLTAVSRFDEDAIIEMVEIADDGHEIYSVKTEWDIDLVLDNAAGVIEYSREDM